jgi:hypothetical protein
VEEPVAGSWERDNGLLDSKKEDISWLYEQSLAYHEGPYSRRWLDLGRHHLEEIIPDIRKCHSATKLPQLRQCGLFLYAVPTLSFWRLRSKHKMKIDSTKLGVKVWNEFIWFRVGPVDKVMKLRAPHKQDFLDQKNNTSIFSRSS